MNSPKISNYDNLDILTFTISDINVSLINAIRRTLLSDIPLVVFKTTPIEQNKCNILVNTSRLNNEIIKQRLSCIPIHIKDVQSFPLDKYYMEVNVENKTNTTIFVTTENFVVKEHSTKKEIDKETILNMFPADDHTGYFIDFLRLRPKLSDELLGESIHLTCDFSIGTAKEDGMFNAVSTCSYGNTIDEDAQAAELTKKIHKWKEEGKTEEQIKFEQENWKLLDGKRLYKKNSFDIILQNYDYTIGKVIEYFMYTKYYEKGICTFCGFKKLHPHDTYSIIRVAYVDIIDNESVLGNVKECIAEAITIYEQLKKDFSRLSKK